LDDKQALQQKLLKEAAPGCVIVISEIDKNEEGSGGVIQIKNNFRNDRSIYACSLPII
jgi:hypothetical protein